eukprot:2213944-Pyramimonas_sp.AAC.1
MPSCAPRLRMLALSMRPLHALRWSAILRARLRRSASRRSMRCSWRCGFVRFTAQPQPDESLSRSGAGAQWARVTTHDQQSVGARVIRSHHEAKDVVL